MLVTQLLQFCWHRFRCQTVQPHCHLIHGPRFNLVARVRRGPAAAGRHSRTDPVRLACLGAGRAPRGGCGFASKMCHEKCQRGAFCYVRPPAVRWPSSQRTLDCLYFAQDAALPCETTTTIPQFIQGVRPQPKFLRPARRRSQNLRFRVGDMSAYAHELVDNGKDGRLVRALHMMRLRCVATPKTNTPLGPCPHIHGGARHSHAQRGAADHTGQGRPL